MFATSAFSADVDTGPPLGLENDTTLVTLTDSEIEAVVHLQPVTVDEVVYLITIAPMDAESNAEVVDGQPSKSTNESERLIYLNTSPSKRYKHVYPGRADARLITNQPTPQNQLAADQVPRRIYAYPALVEPGN